MDKTKLILSWKEFKKYMWAITAQIKRNDDINKAAGVMFPSCHAVTETGPALDTLVELVSFLMRDATGWIEYWLYDLEQGEKYKPGMVQIDGKPVKLKTVYDLYRILKEGAEQ